MAGPSPSDGPPDRHGRQSLLPGVGPGGQERLRGSHAAVVGAGALGCVSLDWLCRAGVGRLTVIDRDVIEPTNLQRQVLYDARHLERGLPKAVAAAERLREIDPGVRVEGHVADVTHANIASLLEGAEVVLDGTDNFETRFLINDHAVRSGTPFVYAGAVGTRAMAAAFASGERSPCLRCVFRDPPPAGSQPTCDTAGVLGPAVGLAASWQAAQAVAILIGREVRTRLVELDPWLGIVRSVDLGASRDAACPCCAQGRVEFLDGSRARPMTELCGRDAVQIASNGSAPDLAALETRLAGVGSFSRNAFLLRGTIEDSAIGLTVFRDGRVLVHGVDSIEAARTIHARYLG